MQKRRWAKQQKGVKDTTKYVTKRGFYMDYHIKVQKSLPAPSTFLFMQLLIAVSSHGILRKSKKKAKQ